MRIFDGSQKEIGRGAQAIIYAYNGYAYKVYDKDYPAEWVNNEILIQDKLIKTPLPVVKYYQTDEPNIIKMDLISGMTLGERLQKHKYKAGVEDLIRLQKGIHQVTDIDLPSFSSTAASKINLLQVDQYRKDIALKCLNDIPDQNKLLHLDFHFLNIMYVDPKYYIIDWVDAKIGNPIFDYARSYVVMNEYVYRLSKKYLSHISKGEGFSTIDLNKAIYVMALLRLREQISEKTLNLIDSLEQSIL